MCVFTPTHHNAPIAIRSGTNACSFLGAIAMIFCWSKPNPTSSFVLAVHCRMTKTAITFVHQRAPFGWKLFPVRLFCVYNQVVSFFAARCYASAAYAILRCLCVCVSVTFVSCVKTSNRIVRLFSPLGSPTILVFPHQTGWQYSDGDP